MRLRLVHTADWQLGFTRAFLAGEAQHRYAEARTDAVRAVGRLAASEGADLVVCAGDVFEHNQVDARTVLRAFDALRDCPVPVYLLPGNHDPLDAASVYRSRAFVEACPPGVHVLDTCDPVEAAPGVELVGVPWPSKRPDGDLVAQALERLAPAPPDVVRVLVAHGSFEGVAFTGSAGAQIARAPVEAALADGRIHYVALGDRHSVTQVGDRIWYPGTPEVTRFAEERPGHALVVDVGAGTCAVAAHHLGSWRFVVDHRTLTASEDVDLLDAWLRGHREQARTVVRLRLDGHLSLAAGAKLDLLLERARETFAAVDRDARGELVVLPDAADRDRLALSGYAARTLAVLLEQAGESQVARDAVGLLHRLAVTA